MLLHFQLTRLLAEAHVDDLRRAASRPASPKAAVGVSLPPVAKLDPPITIRPARLADASALRELAECDSAAVPAVPVLLAEAGGELRAAVSLHDGAAIADPFHHTAWMVQLLHARAAQLRGEQPLRRRHLLRVLTRRRRWAM